MQLKHADCLIACPLLPSVATLNISSLAVLSYTKTQTVGDYHPVEFN